MKNIESIDKHFKETLRKNFILHYFKISGNKESFIDKNESPIGYYPVLKPDLRFNTNIGNICNLCDWRKDCCANIDNACLKYPCMSDRRKDLMSVLFKRIVK
jgi:hypothetical protein